MSDNRDISNNQNNLFAVINRSYERDGVSGKAIQNGLRFNSYTELVNFSAYQKPVMVSNPQIEKLVRDITNISSTPASTKNALKYKASRQRLTKAELIGAVEVKPAPIPRPVYPVAPPP